MNVRKQNPNGNAPSQYDTGFKSQPGAEGQLGCRVLFKTSADGQQDDATISALAVEIVLNRRIELARIHVSKVKDSADPYSNALFQMFELLAHRSRYADGNHKPAPGGGVKLDVRMLRAIIELTKYYTFSISEFAGGCHASQAHYRGVAFDVNRIDGKGVNLFHRNYRDFMADCTELGATKVFGPPSKGHETHVHAEWSYSPHPQHDPQNN